MADWCRYLQGSSNFWCERTGEYPSYSMINSYCKNGGYGCSHYWISTYVGVILKKPFGKDETIKNIEKLRRDLEQDENYINFIKMYDAVGPSLAEKLNYDKERILVSTKLYDIMTGVSTLMEKGKKDRAVYYYCNMVGALVNKYGLNNLYDYQAEFWNKAIKEAKKVPKLTKNYCK